MSNERPLGINKEKIKNVMREQKKFVDSEKRALKNKLG